jgi:WhiB family redox-sensing transcriptional regulator
MSDTLISPLLPPLGAWARQAACREADPKLFDATSTQRAQRAVQLCETCPVKDACLQEALDQKVNPEGIWGGTTHLERRRIRRYGSLQAAPEGMAAINAAKTHCKRGHEFTPENTRWSNGHRSCRACYNQWLRDRRAATRKAAA